MKLAKVERDKLYVVQERVGFYGKVWHSVAVFDNERDMLTKYPHLRKEFVLYVTGTEGIKYYDTSYRRYHGCSYDEMRKCEVYSRYGGYWQKDTTQSA